MKQITIVGQMDNTQDHTFESANRVYGSENCMPTLPTSCGGGHTPKVIKQYEKRELFCVSDAEKR